MSHANILTTAKQFEVVARATRVVAVVGMKDETRPWEPAFAIPKMLVEHGIEVIPVNPTIASSMDRPSYARLADVPAEFDLVDVFRRSDRIAALADEILALPRLPEAVWLQSGIRDDAAARRLAEAGIRVVQDACLGVIAAQVRARV